MEYTVEVENLTKEYPLVKRYRDILLHPLTQKKITALQDVSFSVHKGELFGLLGPNGAGKTTLLKILATLILPDKGTVRVNGFEVAKKARQVRHSMGFVVNEERSFYWRLTGWQNLEFFAVLNNIKKHNIPSKLDKALTLTGLKQDAHRMFKDYSAGMKQRLAIARSLLAEPDILIMDEPTRSLDPSAAKHLRDFIKEELVGEKGKTVCLSTHNLHEAEGLCSRLAILHKGKLLACDSPQNIKSLMPTGRILEIFIIKGTVKNAEASIRDICLENGYKPTVLSEKGHQIKLGIEADIHTDISPIVGKFSDAGFRVSACSPKEITLEEAFDKIIG